MDFIENMKWNDNWGMKGSLDVDIGRSSGMYEVKVIFISSLPRRVHSSEVGFRVKESTS